jgi:hypothetical protein
MCKLTLLGVVLTYSRKESSDVAVLCVSFFTCRIVMNMIINRKIIAAISTTIYSKPLTNLILNQINYVFVIVVMVKGMFYILIPATHFLQII